MGISAQELRIGNLINYLGEPTVVTSISQSVEKEELSYISTQKSGINTNFSYRPIPLTEEILLKFGFTRYDEYNGHGFIKDNLCLWKGNNCEFYNFSIYGRNEDGINEIYIDFEFVHQLQNFYFALKGEELTFKNL